jgi:predicted outer membrane protein
MKEIIMKTSLTLAAVLGVTSAIGAAELKERHLVTNPINNITTTKADRAFMTDAAAHIIQQKLAAVLATQFASPTNFVETAHATRDTLEDIHLDLQGLAKKKGVALPLEGSIEYSRHLQKLFASRSEDIEREYEEYAERNSLRMLERFYEASRNAEDREVRAFALRYLRPIYGNYQAATWLDVPSGTAIVNTRPKMPSERVAAMLPPPTASVTVAASPAR